MTRRTVAGFLALGLIAALVAFGLSRPVPWVIFSPGPTIDVLADLDGKEIVQISGREVFRDAGELRMVTVSETRPEARLSLLDMYSAWVNRDDAVLPDSIYPEDTTDEEQRQQSAAQMTSSQESAIAAALGAAGISYGTTINVAGVAEDGPSAGLLKDGDVLLRIGGRPVSAPEVVVAAVQAVPPGTPLEVVVRRAGQRRVVTVTTGPAEEDPSQSRIGIGIGLDYAFPFKVNVRIPDTVGGPSAGSMFALSIYDRLTPGALTGGRIVAGTGTITDAGVIGPIGGVAQKIAAAERDGAGLFLVPEENCDEAAAAHYDSAKIRLVRVHTLQEAITAIEDWASDDTADLPRCA